MSGLIGNLRQTNRSPAGFPPLPDYRQLSPRPTLGSLVQQRPPMFGANSPVMQSRPPMYDPNNPGATDYRVGGPATLPKRPLRSKAEIMAPFVNAQKKGRELQDWVNSFSNNPDAGYYDNLASQNQSFYENQANHFQGFSEPVPSSAAVNQTQGIIPPESYAPYNFDQPTFGKYEMPERPTKRGLFGKKANWADVLGFVGDAFSDRGPQYAQRKMHLADLMAENKRRDDEALRRRQWAVEDRNWKANQPDYFMSGRDRVRFNPVTGDSQVVFDAPEDFEQYAQTMGLEPGTDDYFNAVEDYVLRGNGPTALGYDKQLDDHRLTNDKSLDDYRTGNRLRVRGSPTWQQANSRPKAAKPSTGKQKRPTASDGKGNRVEWNGSAWVPVK